MNELFFFVNIFNCSKIPYKYVMKYSVGAQCCFRGELPCISPFLFGHFLLLNVLVLNVQFQLSEALEILYFLYI